MGGFDFKRYSPGDRESASDHNKAMNLLSSIAGSMRANAFVSSGGVLIRNAPNIGDAVSAFKIFAVDSSATATGDGIYDCFEQKLLDAEWDDTAGDIKFSDKDAVKIEVLNLAEGDPEATYLPHLVENDLIMAYQMTDDEGAKRWVGVPFQIGNADRIRRAYCSGPAGAGKTIDANLDSTSGTLLTGPATVNCNISGGANLNAAVPRLEDEDEILITKIGGKWYCLTVFQASQECV